MKRDHAASEFVEKMGTEAFVRMASKGNPNEKTLAQRDGGKGRIKHRYCGGCRKYVIENYEAKGHGAPCVDKPAQTKSKEFRPYFNQGLGAFVSSRSEEKRIAKSMGLVEAG